MPSKHICRNCNERIRGGEKWRHAGKKFEHHNCKDPISYPEVAMATDDHICVLATRVENGYILNQGTSVNDIYVDDDVLLVADLVSTVMSRVVEEQ